MKRYATKALRQQVEATRVHILKQKGLVLTHDKRGRLIDFKIRY
jgi:hypothetical protein